MSPPSRAGSRHPRAWPTTSPSCRSTSPTPNCGPTPCPRAEACAPSSPASRPDRPARSSNHTRDARLDSHDEMCRRLAAGTNAAVIALDCRPAPEHPYPAAVNDAHAAIESITNQADARSAIARPLPPAQTYGQGDYGITTALLDWYSDQYAPGTAADDPYCAPVRAADVRNLPPAHIHTAEPDPLRDDEIDSAQRLRHAHVTVEHHDPTGLFRGFHPFTATASTSARPSSHRD